LVYPIEWGIFITALLTDAVTRKCGVIPPPTINQFKQDQGNPSNNKKACAMRSINSFPAQERAPTRSIRMLQQCWKSPKKKTPQRKPVSMEGSQVSAFQPFLSNLWPFNC